MFNESTHCSTSVTEMVLSKTVWIGARISPELARAQDDYAKKHDRSKSWIVSEALKKFLGPARTPQRSDE